LLGAPKPGTVDRIAFEWAVKDMDVRLQHYPSQAETERPATALLVWDLPLRLFHWTMVVVVAVAGITGFFAPEWLLDLHVIAGYALGILLAFRLAWGFVGSRYSRFGSFPPALGGAYRHFRSILRGRPRAVIGHNPAGAWMIVILLFALVTLVVTGLVVLGGRENLGPLAAVTAFQTGEIAGLIHEISAWGLVGAVAVHLLGVFAETRIFRHPVLAAMITGKTTAAGLWPNVPEGPHTARGIAWFLAISATLLAAGIAMANIPSPTWRPVAVPAAYVSECGDCHHAYHPSLRTGETWRTMMNGLENHYGEDASIDRETATVITSYLEKNHAGTFDTEAAHRVGRMETPSLRMTDTPYWKARHRDIDPSVFRLRNVGSKVNCNGCHKDAASGRFDDVKIRLPVGGKS